MYTNIEHNDAGLLGYLELVCFTLANEEYAVDIKHVQEVIKVPKITKIPQLPDFVLGAINIRGNIVPVFDLRRQFQLAEKPLDSQSKLLVLKLGGGLIEAVLGNRFPAARCGGRIRYSIILSSVGPINKPDSAAATGASRRVSYCGAKKPVAAVWRFL